MLPGHCAHPSHDSGVFGLSIFICVGLIVSYLPQHYRIISNKTSEGFSAWYLFLGATSSASSLLNVIALQWNIIECSRFWPLSTSIENAMGILQILFQWFLFNMILALFLIYFPPEQKYSVVTRIEADQAGSAILPNERKESFTSRLKAFFWPSLESNSGVVVPRARRRTNSSSSADEFDQAVLLPSWNNTSTITYSHEFRLAVVVAIGVIIHFIVFALITLMLLLGLPKSDLPEEPGRPEHPSTRLVHHWAKLLGILSTALACAQYIPQLVLTFHTRLVGSLSIPMMMIQTPGSFVFVYSYIAGDGRAGVDWTTWLVYLVTGCLQGCLLLMCCAWKLRQKAAGVDDYGRDIFRETTESSDRAPLLRNRKQSSRSRSPSTTQN